MNAWFRRLILGTTLLLLITVITGCGEKRKKVQVIEEQREGEVIEQGRGSEMVVE